MIHVGCKRSNVKWSRVAGLRTCSQFLLSSVLLFVPYVRISCLGWGRGFHPLCLDPFPLLTHLSFFSLSLALMHIPNPGSGRINAKKREKEEK